MNIWTTSAATRGAAQRMSRVERAARLSEELFELASSADDVGAFPDASIEVLRRGGLLSAPLPEAFGGAGLGRSGQAEELMQVLRVIGGGDLSVGRLVEGHVNALLLVERYGRPDQMEQLAQDVSGGAMSAVWNAEGAQPLRFIPDGPGWVVQGCKILASGAGSIARPLVTGLIGDDQWMAVLRLDPHQGADLSRWTPQGMRSSATGTIDLTGYRLTKADLIGGPADYKTQPGFSGGAWRFCAVQLGAIERLVDLFRQGLRLRGRDQDPYQQARVAACVAATETAALWIGKAARLVERETLPRDEVVAYVGLTRMVTERAGLDVMEHVHRGIGLMSFMRPDPIERVSRDLATYLRQPAPDGAMADAAAMVLRTPLPMRDLWGGDDRR